jgi:MFS family permease
VISRYGVILEARSTRQLLLTSLVARLPVSMSTLAILLFVEEQTGSFGVAGLAVGAFALATALVTPVQGILVDRMGHARVLLPLAVAQGAVYIAFVPVSSWAASPAAFVGMAALAGALRPPVMACVRVLWPVVAPDPKSRDALYALDATSQELLWIVGPLLVGAISVASPGAAIVACAACTIVGSFAFAALPASRSWVGGAGRRGRGGALASNGLRWLMTSVLLCGLGIGAVDIALPALASQLSHAEAGGALIAALSLGSLVTGLLYGSRAWRSRLAVRYGVLLLLFAATIAPLMLAGSMGAAVALSVVAGVAQAPAFSCQYALTASLTPAGSAAEAFAWNSAALTAGLGLGSAVAGWAIDSAGAMAGFGLSVVAFILAAVIVASRIDQMDAAVVRPLDAVPWS